jgi:hypothetical protein
METVSEREILTQGLELLAQTVPPGWKVDEIGLEQSVIASGELPGHADAMFTLSAQGQVVRILVEAKSSFAPRDVPQVLGGWARRIRQVAGDIPVVVMAPWLSERTRRLLVEAGFNYLDLTGNVRLQSTYPAVYIDRNAPSTRPRIHIPRQGLRGVKAGRIVRFLADVRPPYGVLELAQVAGVTAGYASRILEYLEREAIVERTVRGGVRSVDWQQLLRQRAHAYSVFERNVPTRWFTSTNLAAFLGMLREAVRVRKLPPPMLTGSFAATAVADVPTDASLLCLYTTGDPTDLLRKLDIAPAETRTNVILLQPYNSIVFERPYPQSSKAQLPLVACSQIVIDCLTGPDTMRPDGEALIGWMTAHEDLWRLPGLSALKSEPTAVTT